MHASLQAKVINHHLLLLGWQNDAVEIAGPQTPLLLCRASEADLGPATEALAIGRTVVAVRPAEAFCRHFGVTIRLGPAQARTTLTPVRLPAHSRNVSPRLVTLHPVQQFIHGESAAILHEPGGGAVWCSLKSSKGVVVFIGTDLAGDLVRYRQGDPCRVANGQKAAHLWGYPGERPNYLFEEQRQSEPPHTRHADEWAHYIACLLAGMCGVTLAPVLPENAPGAVVLTGDTDAATSETVAEQLRVLGGLPITYFLHPRVDYSINLIEELKRRDNVELAIHPDALDDPERYIPALADQIGWFEKTVGHRPMCVRNHGFLNRGYWGHLEPWIASGLLASSNLPGFDGNVITGSLLPARVAFGAELTPHWSIVTLIGDGIMFVKQASDTEAEECIYRAAQHIIDRGIPGVMVFNLHPINIQKTMPMHRAIASLVHKHNFVPWNMRDCIDWFSSADQ